MSGNIITYRRRPPSGFGLIEVLIIIIVLGILAAVAMRTMTALLADSRRIETEREMDMLARAIVGDPSVTAAGVRSDFGYFGDIGAFPPDLRALYRNPAACATWKGPYLPSGLVQDSVGFRLDGWGAPYVYAGGTVIISTGSGTTMTKNLADAPSDYLSNPLDGTVEDAAGAPPGPLYKDSVQIVITVPDGNGGAAAHSVSPDSAGRFQFSDLPAGSHPVQVVFTPASDTLHRFATILPRNKSAVRYKFALAHFGASTGRGRRCELVVQASQVAANLAGFPLLITESNLPPEMLDADGPYPAAAGGGDIWFSSDAGGAVRLPCEIQKFSPNPNPDLARAEIWVKMPSVSASGNTSFYVWYANPGQTQPAPDQPYGACAAWDGDYVVVQHLNETPSGPAPQCIDATGRANNGTAHGAMNSSDQVAGQVGGSLDFDGVNDFINIPAAGVTVTGHAITLEAWIYVANSGGRAEVVQRGSNYALWEIGAGGFPCVAFYSGGWQRFNFGKNANWFRNAWRHITCAYDGSQVLTYIDGAPDRDYAYTNALDPYTANYDLGIALNVGWNDAYFQGRIDEVRISKSARSAGWIRTQFNNQSDPAAFVRPSTPETP